MEVNGKLIRELWVVRYRSSHMVKGADRSLERQDIDVANRVWAYDGLEAIEYVKKHPPKSQSGPLPFLGLLGLESTGLLEAHILNQPKQEEEVQPSNAPPRPVLVDSRGTALTSEAPDDDSGASGQNGE